MIQPIRRTTSTVLVIALLLSISAPSWSGGHRYIPPVPPTLELEVLDPRVDPAGNPTVVLNDQLNCEGRIEKLVDIPPTVIVHKYYYTGDRNFQGPLIAGGPTIIVAEHPKSHERLYIDAQLPPGAPRIHYTSHTIEYAYTKHSVVISFGCFGKAKVTYRNGVPLTRQLSRAGESVVKAAGNVVNRTGIPDAGEALVRGTANLTTSTLDKATQAGRMATLTGTNIARLVPLSQTLVSDAEDQARFNRDITVERASRRLAREEFSIEQNR